MKKKSFNHITKNNEDQDRIERIRQAICFGQRGLTKPMVELPPRCLNKDLQHRFILANIDAILADLELLGLKTTCQKWIIAPTTMVVFRWILVYKKRLFIH